jgi:hypothetical protein
MTAALLGQHFAQRYGSSVPTRLPVSLCVT